MWYVDGKRHRLDGPALSWVSSSLYFINNIQYTPSKFPRAVANWISYVEVTKQDVETVVGNYRIVQW